MAYGYTVSLGSSASQNEGNPAGTAATFVFNLARQAGEAGSVDDYRYEIRNAATRKGIPCITTLTGASAAARAISAGPRHRGEVLSLQELHGGGAAAGGAGGA